MKSSLSRLSWLSCLLLLLPACKGAEEDPDCTPGLAGCPCADGLCLGGLPCLSNFCVDPNAPVTTTQTDPSGDPATDPSPDPTDPPTTDPTDPPTTDPTTDPTADPTSSDETGGEPGGPIILQFLTNVVAITEGETITFTAVVTDPDGVEDVIGGSLTSPDGKIGYGAFATSGQEGSYEITLSWAQITQAETIEFETPSKLRSFRAEFFDQGGKSAAKIVDISLDCDDGLRVTPAACAGSCTDLDSDSDNCSHCAIACTEHKSGAGACENSVCTPTFQGCVASVDFMSCDMLCGGLGETCVEAGCSNNTSIEIDSCEPGAYTYYNYDHPCDEEVFGSYIACCCTQTI